MTEFFPLKPDGTGIPGRGERESSSIGRLAQLVVTVNTE